MLEHLLADLGVELGEHLAQDLGVEVRDQLLAVVGRQEAHQVGDVGRVQGAQQFAQPLGVAAVERVDHHRHVVGI